MGDWKVMLHLGFMFRPGDCAHPEGSIKTFFLPSPSSPFTIVLLRGGFLNSAI